MKVHIIGAGISGAVMAYRYKKAGYTPIVYERDKVMGACWENDDYQLYPHFFHTDYDEVLKFITPLTTIRQYRHFTASYADGEYVFFPPKNITREVMDRRMLTYSFKMWNKIPDERVLGRLKPSNGSYFPDKYQGVLDMRKLFKSLLSGIRIVRRDVKLGYLDGKIILTGAVDEFFGYRYGRLPYRGMNVAHIKTETGLPATCVNYPEADFPFIRITDYRKIGYGPYIGIESPGNDQKHYPVYSNESERLYLKYRKLAEKEGLTLVGRLATYQYIDTDEAIKRALEAEL
jgi:UDP-galactopyranose mutase